MERRIIGCIGVGPCFSSCLLAQTALKPTQVFPEVINLLQDTRDTAESLINHPLIMAVTFVGGSLLLASVDVLDLSVKGETVFASALEGGG